MHLVAAPVWIAIVVITASFSNSGPSIEAEGLALKFHYYGSDLKEMVELKIPMVDKTIFVKELTSEGSARLLITRPRGFGKSFNLSLLKYFFANDTRFSRLFDGFSIAKDVSFCKKYQNKRQVLFVSFARINYTTMDGCRGAFKAVVRRLFQEYSYLSNSTQVKPEDQKFFKAFARGKIEDSQIPLSFSLLVRYLYAHHGRIMCLLDDYDTPIISGYKHKYYDEIRQLMREVLEMLFQHDLVDVAVVTGITNVGLKDLQFKEYPLYDNRFSGLFGFTYADMEVLTNAYNITTPGLVPKMEAMYSGYEFGNITVHNSWDVVGCLRRNGEIDDYWAQACAHEEPYELWAQFGLLPSLKGQFLLSGVRPIQTLRKWMELSEMDTDENMFWTYVTRLGYVGVSRQMEKEDGDMLCELKIPNRELADVLDFVVFGLAHHWKIPPYKKFAEEFDWEQEVKTSRMMEKYANKSGRYFQVDPISTVHGLLTGLEEKRGRMIPIPDPCHMFVFEKAPALVILRLVDSKLELHKSTAERFMMSCFERAKKELPENRVTKQLVVSILNSTIRMHFYP